MKIIDTRMIPRSYTNIHYYSITLLCWKSRLFSAQSGNWGATQFRECISAATQFNLWYGRLSRPQIASGKIIKKEKENLNDSVAVSAGRREAPIPFTGKLGSVPIMFLVRFYKLISGLGLWAIKTKWIGLRVRILLNDGSHAHCSMNTNPKINFERKKKYLWI